MRRQKVMRKKKRTFTVDEANQMLPLVRVIVKDIAELANDLMQRQERLARYTPEEGENTTEAYEEERREIQHEMERDAARLEEYVDELRKLGVELKGWDGLVDFPGLMDGREICLCWKLGEDELAHWHEVDAGFAGRKRLVVETVGTG